MFSPEGPLLFIFSPEGGLIDLPLRIIFSPALPSDCFAIDFPGRAISPGEGIRDRALREHRRSSGSIHHISGTNSSWFMVRGPCCLLSSVRRLDRLLSQVIDCLRIFILLSWECSCYDLRAAFLGAMGSPPVQRKSGR